MVERVVDNAVAADGHELAGIKWKGYSHDDDSWEKLAQVSRVSWETFKQTSRYVEPQLMPNISKFTPTSVCCDYCRCSSMMGD